MDAAQIFEEVRAVVEHISMPEENDTVILFGAGGMGTRTLPPLRVERTITALCDNDKDKIGTVIEGLPCISFDQLLKYPQVFALVSAAKFYGSIHQQLEQMEIRHCSLDAYVVRRHWDEVEAVFNSLDNESQKVYAGILLCRVSGDVSEAENFFCGNPYFALPRFYDLVNRRGAFIDCGAFVGDTVEEMLKHSTGTVPAIYAFEPNDRNFAALQKRVSFLCDTWALDPKRFICEKVAAGAKNEALFFATGDQHARTQITHIAKDAGEVVTVSLDEYLKSAGNPDIELIKADIESYEWDMLHGARETIQRCKPQLAICIYHNIYDFFRIPLYLKELVPDYHFAIRHHGITDSETVLYCW